MTQHIEKVNSIDWTKYSGPKYYDPLKARDAMLKLVVLSEESQNNATYNEVLFAIGNNHGGTYYPAIQGALKIITSVALSHEVEVARNCALEILIDIYASFDAEVDHYPYLSEEELERLFISKLESTLDSFCKLPYETKAAQYK